MSVEVLREAAALKARAELEQWAADHPIEKRRPWRRPRKGRD